MGVFNIVSDIALIILPFPTLRTVQLDLKTLFRPKVSRFLC